MIPVSATESILLGDINQDGVVSIADACTILHYAVKTATPDNNASAYADIDQDGAITTVDARAALRMAAGITPLKTASFSNWETIKEPTCTAEGEAIAYSLNGNHTITKTIPLKPHTVVAATCTEKSYCSECFSYLSDALGHTTQNGVCERCNETINGKSIIHIGNKSIAFGATMSSLVKVFGSPSEILNDTVETLPVKYFVYAKDYSKLTIFTFSDNLGVIGVYSVDPTFQIATTKIVSYNNVMQEFLVGDVYFEGFVDKLGTGNVYAFHATTQRKTTKMYENTNFRSCEKLTFHLANSCRAINNLTPLKYSADVSVVALSHSTDMATNNYFDHKNASGENSYYRLKNANIEFYGCGENIAAGQNISPYDFNNMWYNSSGHRKIMLTPEYDELGVGIAYNKDSKYDFYATQNYINIS
jgi:uncharacterized protein YkwD